MGECGGGVVDGDGGFMGAWWVSTRLILEEL